MAYNQQKNKSNERDAEMTEMRELVDKYLKIARIYMPQMLTSINRTMNVVRGELEDSKKTTT